MVRSKGSAEANEANEAGGSRPAIRQMGGAQA